MSGDPGENVDPPPAFVSELDGEYTRVWQIDIEPGSVWTASYLGAGNGSMEIRGIDEKNVVMVDMDV